MIADIQNINNHVLQNKHQNQWKRRRKLLKKILLNLYFLLMICIAVFVYYATNTLSPLLSFVIFSSIIVVFLSNYGKCCTHQVLHPSHKEHVHEGVWSMAALPYASYSTFRPNTVAPASQTVYIVEQDGLVKQTIITTHSVVPGVSSIEQQTSISQPSAPSLPFVSVPVPEYPSAPSYTPPPVAPIQ